MTLHALIKDPRNLQGTFSFHCIKIMATGELAVGCTWNGAPGDPARSRGIIVSTDAFLQEVQRVLKDGETFLAIEQKKGEE